MSGLTEEQEQRARDWSERTGNALGVVREMIAMTENGDPRCIRYGITFEQARVAVELRLPEEGLEGLVVATWGSEDVDGYAVAAVQPALLAGDAGAFLVPTPLFFVDKSTGEVTCTVYMPGTPTGDRVEAMTPVGTPPPMCTDD